MRYSVIPKILVHLLRQSNICVFKKAMWMRHLWAVIQAYHKSKCSSFCTKSTSRYWSIQHGWNFQAIYTNQAQSVRLPVHVTIDAYCFYSFEKLKHHNIAQYKLMCGIFNGHSTVQWSACTEKILKSVERENMRVRILICQ